MAKSKLNLVIDVVLILLLGAMSGIGLMMKYVLVPGKERWVIYGRNVELYFWGMDRHQWGTLHVIVAAVFAAGVVLHVILHWSQVVGIFQKLIGSRAVRWAVALLVLAAVVVLTVGPLVIKPEVQDGSGGHGGGHGGGGGGGGRGRAVVGP